MPFGSERKQVTGPIDKNRPQTPGPNSYKQHSHLVSKSGSKFSFGVKSFSNSFFNIKSSGPGPGSYNSQSDLKFKSTPKISMATKRVYKTTATPGPAE
mmetsp:Transcript_103752/g.223906  ORF Transcript_103752/g.223906 Transcript_103752/m.223906 type:complete len:98 (-) Transcript_103752:608-901(-)